VWTLTLKNESDQNSDSKFILAIHWVN